MVIYAAYHELKMLGISNNSKDLEPYIGEILVILPNFFTKPYLDKIDYYYCSESDIKFKINHIQAVLEKNYSERLVNRKQELTKLFDMFVKKREQATIQFIEYFNNSCKLKKMYMKFI